MSWVCIKLVCTVTKRTDGHAEALKQGYSGLAEGISTMEARLGELAKKIENEESRFDTLDRFNPMCEPVQYRLAGATPPTSLFKTFTRRIHFLRPNDVSCIN